MLVEMSNFILLFIIGPVLARKVEIFKRGSVIPTNIDASPRLKNNISFRIPSYLYSPYSLKTFPIPCYKTT